MRNISIRVLLATAVGWGLELWGTDVDTAYLNAPLEEEIYIRLIRVIRLAECGLGAGMTLKFVRALYGLKQWARCWNHALDSTMGGAAGIYQVYDGSVLVH